MPVETFANTIQRLAREAAVRLDRRLGAPSTADEIGALKSRIAQLEQRQHLHYEGVWRNDKSYTPGALVTDKGGLWIAYVSVTNTRPGGVFESSRAWQLITKSGRQKVQEYLDGQ